MARIALGLEYSGSHYFGWQRQPEGLTTIQGKLESALSYVADHPVEVTCAGRTDRGVHACCQVVHFDTDSARLPKAWWMGANTQLPSDIRVIWAKELNERFHARFSAEGRHYRYVISTAKVQPAHWYQQVSWYHQPLDLELMQRAAKFLLGEHDFSAFRSSQCQAKSPLRTVSKITWHQAGELLIMDIEANAFLHHMVRNIIGVLLKVGKKEQPVEWVKEVLESGDRTRAGTTAKPNGLYLIKAHYLEEFGLAALTRVENFITML